MLRATHSINVFQKYWLEIAAKKLNHSRISTTTQHYVKAEDKGLLVNEEEKFSIMILMKYFFGKITLILKKKNIKKVKIKTLKKSKNKYKVNSKSL